MFNEIYRTNVTCKRAHHNVSVCQTPPNRNILFAEHMIYFKNGTFRHNESNILWHRSVSDVSIKVTVFVLEEVFPKSIIKAPAYTCPVWLITGGYGACPVRLPPRRPCVRGQTDLPRGVQEGVQKCPSAGVTRQNPRSPGRRATLWFLERHQRQKQHGMYSKAKHYNPAKQHSTYSKAKHHTTAKQHGTFLNTNIIAWQKQYGMHSKAKHHNAAKTTWYISKSKIIVTWLNNMVCIKVQILYYMAKVVVLIQKSSCKQL